MSCLRGIMDTPATVYDIDRSTSTASGQPIETLVLNSTIKVYFAPYSIRTKMWKVFSAGQVSIGDFICISLKPLAVLQVLDIAGEKYQVVGLSTLQVGCKVLGYQTLLERWQH